MADKKLQALDRLTGKLTALRKTLRGEERALLDRMVLSLSAEVIPHAAKADGKTTGKTAGKTAAKQLRSTAGAAVSDVDMHSLNVDRHNADSKTAGKTAAKQLRSTAGAAVSEIELHAMKLDRQTTEGKTAGKQAGAVARITLNERLGAYRITVE